jgi:hypothetical protein
VPPLYSMMVNVGSSSDPCATPRSAPIPSASISLRPRTFTVTFVPFTASFAACASFFGVIDPPGVFESSRHAFTACPIVCPRLAAFSIDAELFPQSRSSSTIFHPSFGFVLNVENSKFAISKFSAAICEISSGVYAWSVVKICGVRSNCIATLLNLFVFAALMIERQRTMNRLRFISSCFPAPTSRYSIPSSRTSKEVPRAFSVRRTCTNPLGAPSMSFPKLIFIYVIQLRRPQLCLREARRYGSCLVGKELLLLRFLFQGISV